tara:strand:- start:12068 stop:12334 length:267 start_codon:yes stop_codon:yes gene_type:complete
MNTETITGFYGKDNQKECDVFVCHDIDDCGGKWYAIEDSKNINYTLLPLSDGVNLERVIDEYTMYADDSIMNEGQLVEEIENADDQEF